MQISIPEQKESMTGRGYRENILVACEGMRGVSICVPDSVFCPKPRRVAFVNPSINPQCVRIPNFLVRFLDFFFSGLRFSNFCVRVFCAKCTANSIPASSDEGKTGREDWEKIRVCNYCHKQWEQGIAVADGGKNASSPGLSPSPSAMSLVSIPSSFSCSSSGSNATTQYSTGPYYQVPYSDCQNPCSSAQVDPVSAKQGSLISPRSINSAAEAENPFPYHFNISTNR